MGFDDKVEVWKKENLIWINLIVTTMVLMSLVLTIVGIESRDGWEDIKYSDIMFIIPEFFWFPLLASLLSNLDRFNFVVGVKGYRLYISPQNHIGTKSFPLSANFILEVDERVYLYVIDKDSNVEDGYYLRGQSWKFQKYSNFLKKYCSKLEIVDLRKEHSN